MPVSRNRLLESLSSDDLRLLEPHLTSSPLTVRKSLEKSNRRIDTVCFPEKGFCSVVAIQSSRKQVEVALIGREGMTGTPILLGNHRTPHDTYVQAAGTAQTIPTNDFRRALEQSRTMRNLLLKFVQVFAIQTAQTAVVNAHAKLEQRLARWLLMAQDRVGGDLLPLTHEFLSLMLGVRRPGVTESMKSLQKLELITGLRGQVRVRDRAGLQRVAGETYGIPEAEYRRLLG